jgi:hypothetical protein
VVQPGADRARTVTKYKFACLLRLSHVRASETRLGHRYKLRFAGIQLHPREPFRRFVVVEQRIRDYLNPNVIGIDPALFARNQQFYRDANNQTITGYHLVYRDSFGLIYDRNALYQEYYSK